MVGRARAAWTGRAIAGLIIIAGILFLAMPLAIVGNTFADAWSSRHLIRLRLLVHQLLTENDVPHDASGYCECAGGHTGGHTAG